MTTDAAITIAITAITPTTGHQRPACVGIRRAMPPPCWFSVLSIHSDYLHVVHCRTSSPSHGRPGRAAPRRQPHQLRDSDLFRDLHDFLGVVLILRPVLR